MTNNLMCCLFDASDVFKRCNDVTMFSRRVSSHGFAEIYIQYKYKYKLRGFEEQKSNNTCEFALTVEST